MQVIEPTIPKYFQSKGNKMGIPVSGTFELTRKCNFNCKMCYVHTEDTSKDINLTADEWLRIAAEAKNEGMIFLLLTGGEPFLYPDFPYLYKKLCEMGFVISINSNAGIINDKILNLLKEYPPNRMNISLYGADDDIYEDICGSRRFSAVLENIKKIQSMGITVPINVTISKYNAVHTEKLHEIIKELNTHIRSISYLFPYVRVSGEPGCNEARLDSKQAAENTFLCNKLQYPEDAMRRKAKQYAKIEKLDQADVKPTPPEVLCAAGRGSFWVNHDGTMTPCGIIPTPAVSLREMSFKDAWEELRKKTAEIRLPGKCSTCKKREMCFVCAASAYSETGSFDKVPEFLCEFTDNLIKLYKDEYLSDDPNDNTIVNNEVYNEDLEGFCPS